MSSDSSESEESEDHNNTRNHQLNVQQTEAVIKCFHSILKLISRVLKNKPKNKEHRKKIRKEKRKAKLKKFENDDLQTPVQKLCNTIKESFSPFYVQAEIPGCSRCSEAVPGTSRSDTELPGNSRRYNETAIPGCFKSHTETGNASTSSTETMQHSIVQAKPDQLRPSTGPSRIHSKITIRYCIEKVVPVTTISSSNHTKTLENLRNCNQIIVPDTKSSINHIKTPGNLRTCNEKIVTDTAINYTKPTPEANSCRETTKSVNFRSYTDPLISGMISSSETEHESDGITENRIEQSCGVSKSNSDKNPVSSRKHTEMEIIGVSKKCSDAAESEALMHTKTKAVVSKMSGDSTRAMLGSYKSPNQTASCDTSKNYTGNISTKTNTVASKMSSNSTKAIIKTSKSPTGINRDTSTNCTEKIVTTISKDFTKAGIEKLKSRTETIKPVTSQSNTDTVYEPVESRATVPESVGSPTKPGYGPSKSHSERKVPESSRNTEIDVTRTSINRSDVVKSGTSIHTEINTVDSKNLSSNTKIIPETSKSPSKAAPVTMINNTEKVRTITSDNVSNIGKEAPKSFTKITKSVNLRGHTDLLVSGTIQSRAAERVTVESSTKAVSVSSRNPAEAGPDSSKSHSKTKVHKNSTKSMCGTCKTDTNTVFHRISGRDTVTVSLEASESNNIVVVQGPSNRREDNLQNKESINSQIFIEEKIITMEKDKTNNNKAATKINTEASLKRNNTISNYDEPKRVRLDHKCTLCGKSISNDDYAEHYKKKHGMHHEIKHNNKNYEHKIKDLDKRLGGPVNRNKNKPGNEHEEKKTVNSKKRSLTSTYPVPNERSKQTVLNSTLVEIVGTELTNEPEDKKKKAVTRLDSASNERIEQTSVKTLRVEANQNTVLDDSVIDLTDDNDLCESKSPTNVTVEKCSSKPTEDDHILNDHLFIDHSDDTSLYEIPQENEIKSAEALLLKNVKKEEGANDQFDPDIEMVSNVFPTLLNNQKPTVQGNINSTKQQIKQRHAQGDPSKKRDGTEAIVPESARSVPGSSIRIERVTGNPLKADSETAKKLKVTVSAAFRTEVNNGASGSLTGTVVGLSKDHSNVIPDKRRHTDAPKISISQSDQTNQKMAQRESLQKRNDKFSRELPYEIANRNKLDPSKVSEAIATNTIVNAPKVSKLNSTTTITMHSTQEANQSNCAENHTHRVNSNMSKINTDNNFTGTTITSLKPEVSVSNSTAGKLKQQTEKAKQSNAKKKANELTTNLSIPGLTITSVNVPSVPVSNPAVFVTLPNENTTTQSKPIANQNASWHNSDASTSVLDTHARQNIITSNLNSAHKKQSIPRRDSVTKPRKQIPIQKNPANENTNLIGSKVRKSDHRQNGLSSESQSRDRNTENASIAFIQNSSNRSSETNQLLNTKQPTKVVSQTTTRTLQTTSAPRSNAQSNGREINITTNIQSSQIPWYPPKPLIIQDLRRNISQNMNSSNIASERVTKRRASTTLNDTQPRRYSWHTPVEPGDERPVTNNQNKQANVTLNPLSNPVALTRQSPPSQTINQRQSSPSQTVNQGQSLDQRIPNLTQPSTSEVGQPHLLIPRQSSTMIDKRRSHPKTDRTWHIPVEDPIQN